jgi:pimeloyl-ACP methyl ester carboxylesterase
MEVNNSNAEETFIIFYGMSQRMEETANLVNQLNLPSKYRVLVPEILGHGRDVKRAASETLPSRLEMVEALERWMDILEIQHAVGLGFSLGGGALYHLQVRNPTRFQRTILISPAIEHVIDPNFVQDFQNGTKDHMAFETRDSLKTFFRDMSTPHRSKKDPVPKFFLQGVVKLRQDALRYGGTDYYRKLFNHLNHDRGMVQELAATSDEIPYDDARLILWPLHDNVCSYAKGKAFFADSKCKFVSINDSGHGFRSDGEPLLSYCLDDIQAFLDN